MIDALQEILREDPRALRLYGELHALYAVDVTATQIRQLRPDPVWERHWWRELYPKISRMASAYLVLHGAMRESSILDYKRRNLFVEFVRDVRRRWRNSILSWDRCSVETFFSLTHRDLDGLVKQFMGDPNEQPDSGGVRRPAARPQGGLGWIGDPRESALGDPLRRGRRHLFSSRARHRDGPQGRRSLDRSE